MTGNQILYAITMMDFPQQQLAWLGDSNGAVDAVPVVVARHAMLPADDWAILDQGFGVACTLVDGATGEVRQRAADGPPCDGPAWSETCRRVARQGRPELIAVDGPLAVLAIPLAAGNRETCVAVATFVTRPASSEDEFSRAPELLGTGPAEAAAWAARQTAWSADSLLRMGRSVMEQLAARRRIEKLVEETDVLSDHIGATYEEISLLHRLTQNLKVSKSDEDLGRLALEWLAEVLPARGLAIQLASTAEGDPSPGRAGRQEPVLLTHGRCPVDQEQFTRLMEHLARGRRLDAQPVVINRGTTGRDDWPWPQVRQVMAAPLADGENLFGWVAAFDHVTDGEFGTGEASLLNSVAIILGIHNGNILLVERQAEMMGGIIRALTAAIDAKDPYTCGHSDRVARIAVRLARELGLDGPALNTIYLAGLLHDIGKIGIADSVLRKPGKLTDEEYRHIKTHPAVGERILHDLKKLDNILPVILHHHEAWDGAGYPLQLQADGIPRAARIIAVADSFDAMGSDRPYRKGMSADKIDAIFREGSGRQWDPEVVAAFFLAREDLQAIVDDERDGSEGPSEVPFSPTSPGVLGPEAG